MIDPECDCDFPETCGGGGVLHCDGCGGEMPCECPDCDPDDNDPDGDTSL